MSISQRKHNRLTVDIPVYRYTREAERIETLLYQIGIGGCLIAWDETITKGDEFRMEIRLPNGNWLPLHCKALYCFRDDAIGVQFKEISQFEQELLVEVMSNSLTKDGIPFNFDPFARPKSYKDPERELPDDGVAETGPASRQEAKNIFA